MQTRGLPDVVELSPVLPTSGESDLTGAPAARRLYREIAAGPADPRRVVVVGPGGSGKSALLDALADLYRAAGVEVHRQVPTGAATEHCVLVVDDAHELDEPALEPIRRWSMQPGARVLLAHRPWPRPPALSGLVAAFGASRAPLVLGPLDRSGVAGRAGLVLGTRPSSELVDLVAEQTGGSPLLVDRLLAAWHESGALDGADPPGEPPAAVLHQLGYAVDALPGPVRDLLVALAVGTTTDPDILGALLGVSGRDLADLLAEAESTGLLRTHGAVAPLVRHALTRSVSVAQQSALRRRLAEIQLERGGDVLAVARVLLGTGATGAGVAAAFERAGDEALRDCLPVAGEFYAAAVEAGTPVSRIAARHAEAALLRGDLTIALARADRVLAEPSTVEPAEAVRAATVAAAVLAHRGLLARSVELYRWSAEFSPSRQDLLAVPVLVGTGDLEQARRLLAEAAASRPTVLAAAEALVAEGVVESIVGSTTAALSRLTRAAALLEWSGRAALLPDSPAALAALVAVHCGELDVARSVLDGAIATDLGGPSTVTRHRLLQAWIAMHRGALVQVRTLLAVAPPPLEPRDELLAAALEVGLARRTGDLAALLTAWGRAREAIVRHPVDLYSLAPLGELWVAAARLHEQSWVEPHRIEAAQLLARLGDPPLWSTPMYWSGLQAAILSDDGEVARRHAAALDGVAGTGRYAGAMAAAARQWLTVLAGEVDAVAVEAAARGLHAVGLSWEGGRLAGQAAIRTRDRKDMGALLGCARALQSGTVTAGTVEEPSAAPGCAPPAERLVSGAAAPATLDGMVSAAAIPAGTISDREREVAELVLAGLTYRQIGEQLFISAKTVEHHVSRMRQRLGSENRGELFARLRMLVGQNAG